MSIEYIDDEFEDEEEFTVEYLLSDEAVLSIFEIEDDLKRTKRINELSLEAKKLKIYREFKSLLEAHKSQYIQYVKSCSSNDIEFTDPPLEGLKCGTWKAQDTGIKKPSFDPFSDKSVLACQHPIMPIARLVNVDSTVPEKVRLAFYKDHKWQNTTVEKVVVSDKSLLVKTLSNRGIEVTTKNALELIEYISDVLSLNTERIPVLNSVSTLGWQEGEFAPYSEAIHVDCENEYKHLLDSVSQKGDRDKWMELMKKHRNRIENRLAMAASFASVLVDRLGTLPFVFLLWGGSGTGKTVSCMCAMSIWGNPSKGKLMISLNNTANFFARTASFLKNLPFFADELQIVKGRWDNLDKLIMFLCEGIDRGTAKNYGGVNATKTWSNSFIFSGEEPVAKANSGAGMKNRLIEIEVSEPIVTNGKDVVNVITENYGFAGPEFVSALSKYDIHKIYKGYYDVMIDRYDTTQKQAMAMACILTADYISVKEIFTEEKSLEVEDVSKYLFSEKDIDISERAYEWIINFIAVNQNRFKDSEDRFEIWGRLYEEEGYCLINKNVLTEKLNEAGFDYFAVMGKMADKGQIMRNTQGYFVHQTKAYGIKGSYIKVMLLYSEVTSNNEEFPF